jgi:rhodanese-related sulfurtransferase
MLQTISPSELDQLHQDGNRIDLIDVRTPAEFREVHVEYARNVPLDRLDCRALMDGRNGSRSQPLYLICRSGNRARHACDKFVSAGFDNVIHVDGGMLGCVDANLPVVRGKRAVSLERQVRIAAGFLVLLGVLLGWFVNPWLAGISAFVGAGLMFAGITDTCGMAMLLAKMPWNQVKDKPSCAC